MGFLIGTIKHSLGWVFTLFALGTLIFLGVLTLGYFRRNGAAALLRFWGRGMLFIAGVRLDKQGLEILKKRSCRILTLNHTSSLDLFIVCSFAPNGSIHIVKKEFFYLPIIGQAAWILGVHFLDRSNPKRAIQSLGHAATRMREEQGTVCIAPEGTRSRDGRLNPFKLGVFHLAMKSQATIYPLLIDGAHTLWPRSAWYCRSGTVKVRILEPVDPSDFTEDNLREKAEMVRAMYAEALGQTPESDAS
jgi:1-acyl-sn-glycerol-3-phosphate acyltransferase